MKEGPIRVLSGKVPCLLCADVRSMMTSPLPGPFMAKCMTAPDLDELNIEIIRNTLYKEYLETFHKFCQELGDPTSNVMNKILQFEADRRAFNITVNSFGTELSKDERAKLYPTIGTLFPEGLNKLKDCNDHEEVQAVVRYYDEYAPLFAESGSRGVGEKTLEDRFFEYEVSASACASAPAPARPCVSAFTVCWNAPTTRERVQSPPTPPPSPPPLIFGDVSTFQHPHSILPHARFILTDRCAFKGQGKRASI